MEQADAVMVARLVPRDSARADSTEARGIIRSSRLASNAPADVAWRRRLVKSLMVEKQYVARAACTGCWPCSQADQLAGLVSFNRGAFTLQVLLLFRERCAEFRFDQGRGGTVRFETISQSVLDLLKQCLPADSALQATALPAPAPVRPSQAPSDYVYVESLPEAIHREEPYYPPDADERGTRGTVLVMALVGKDGMVKDTRVIWSIPGLEEAAVSAVRHWRFKPATSEGRPVPVWVSVPVSFKPR
jgi:TonB family protein